MFVQHNNYSFSVEYSHLNSTTLPVAAGATGTLPVSRPLVLTYTATCCPRMLVR